MSNNTEGLAAKLAQLARIELSQSQLDSTQAQLGSILAYIETLGELDLEKVPEWSDEESDGASLRQDHFDPQVDSFDPQSLLAGAPRRREDLVEVPKVKEEGR